jgi:hypothetical protein
MIRSFGLLCVRTIAFSKWIFWNLDLKDLKDESSILSCIIDVCFGKKGNACIFTLKKDEHGQYLNHRDIILCFNFGFNKVVSENILIFIFGNKVHLKNRQVKAKHVVLHNKKNL